MIIEAPLIVSTRLPRRNPLLARWVLWILGHSLVTRSGWSARLCTGKKTPSCLYGLVEAVDMMGNSTRSN